MEVVIRELKKDEIPALSELATKTFVDAFANSFEDKDELDKILEETRSEHYFKSVFDDYTILVAVNNDKLIGYIQFGDVDIEGVEPEDGDQELSRVYILTDYQNKGIGKKLIETAFNYPNMKSANKIYLDVWKENQRAKKLYESYGFKETGLVVGDGDIVMIRVNKISKCK